jgi:flagellar motor switch protein FliN/FliY
LASDLSNIVKSEIVSTLESLLSVKGSVEDVVLMDGGDLGDQQCVKVESDFSFSSMESKWTFFVPTETGTKFEYLMLGGIADLKDAIDDEISDAVKEIISTISGSITTSVNAQGFDDVSGMSFSLGDSSVISCSDEQSDQKVYKFVIKLNDEELLLFIMFDELGTPFIESLTKSSGAETAAPAAQIPVESNAPAPTGSVLTSLLGDESVENLRLLFDVKLRLSVRLGTKICLLRDVISWDIGEIIELTQMTNEPLDILVNGIVIGQGEAVIVDGKFGVKIKHIGEARID